MSHRPLAVINVTGKVRQKAKFAERRRKLNFHNKGLDILEVYLRFIIFLHKFFRVHPHLQYGPIY